MILKLTLIVTLITLPSLSLADTLQGHPRVIDGDTIEIAGEKIRLHGIDAPEIKQMCHQADGTEYACGEMATFALAEIIERHWVVCKGDTRDRYKRWIMVCYTGPYDINAKMVERGWAVAYRKYSKDYVDEENIASDTRVGIWQGDFKMPWEWRRK